MRWAVVLLPVLLACSAVGFQPAECSSLSPDNQGIMHGLLYRDLMRGTYSGDCFEFRGEVSQSIDGGYIVDTDDWGGPFPGDVFVRWEGDYRFVPGDIVVVTGAVAEPLTFETVLGVERTIPAFYGSELMDMQQHAAQESATRQVIRATQEVIAVTRQVEYRADYEARTADALQEIQSSCHDSLNFRYFQKSGHRTSENINSWFQHFYSDEEISNLDLNFSIGPAPDDIDYDTVPHVLLNGTFTAKTVRGEYAKHKFTKDVRIIAVWTGSRCEFTDIKTENSPLRTPDPRDLLPTSTPFQGVTYPTRDPDTTPKPTVTPRPVPTKEKKGGS